MATRRFIDGGLDGDWTNTANWSGGVVPISGDDVYIDSTSRDIATNLGQSAVALTSLNISKNFVGTLGTFDTPLQIGAVTVSLGYINGQVASPAGSGRIHLDLGSTTAATVRVFGSASSAADDGGTTATSDGVNPIRIKAANAATDIFVSGGFVSLADVAGETSTYGEVSLSSVDGASGIVMGQQGASAVTLTTLDVEGGNLLTFSGATTANVRGGILRTLGDAVFPTVNVEGGSFRSNAKGLITTLNANGGTTNFDGSDQPRNVTTLNIKKPGRVRLNPGVVTVAATNFTDVVPVDIAVT